MPEQHNDRVTDGFSVLDGGMNDGIAASLIAPNQVAFASDVSFRGGYAKTRGAFTNLLLAFDSTVTQTNFAGVFQGACAFQSQFGDTGFIISRGGRLFFLKLGLTNVISEITPSSPVVTAQLPGGTLGLSFVVPPLPVGLPPGIPYQVIIYVSDSTPFSASQGIVIAGGNYLVASVGDGYIVALFAGGATPGTQVPIGISIVDDTTNSPIYSTKTNPASYDFVYLFQAEIYTVALAGQNKPVIFDGATARTAGPGEIPPGIFGIYLWGRIWVALPNRRNFIAGDLVGSSSGSPSLAYVDSILKVTENNFLNGGGAFSSPANKGPLTAFSELAILDTSLGTGNLLAGTTRCSFSVNTPVDRTTWQNLTYPIQTIAALDPGPVGPRFTANSNSDLWWRSRDGIRSFKSARREIQEDGNTPQSQEIRNLLYKDDKSLLFYGSSILFDNRLLFTVSPYRDPNGVAHRGIAALNLDTVSNLRQKLPPEWEGVYTGLNVLQLVALETDDQERGFVFALNGTAVELWELDSPANYDTFISADGTTVTRTAIQPVIETRAFNCSDGDQLKQLLTASIYLSGLVDNVTLVIKYRPDQHPNWTTWATVNLCANVSQCSIIPADPAGTCRVWKQNKAQYAAKVILPQPEGLNNPITSRPMSWGYEHQIRIEATGKFVLRAFKIECEPQSQATSGIVKDKTCQTVSGCDTPIFSYNAHG